MGESGCGNSRRLILRRPGCPIWPRRSLASETTARAGGSPFPQNAWIPFANSRRRTATTPRRTAGSGGSSSNGFNLGRAVEPQIHAQRSESRNRKCDKRVRVGVREVSVAALRRRVHLRFPSSWEIFFTGSRNFRTDLLYRWVKRSGPVHPQAQQARNVNSKQLAEKQPPQNSKITNHEDT